MKLIHCADLHLDAKMQTHLDKETAKIRRAELLTTFERMVKFGARHEVEAILIAGDLFDTKQISATARNVVWDAICTHPRISFYYLKGNHDRDNFLDSVEELPANLFLFEDRWSSYELGMTGKVVLTGVELSKANSGSIYHDLVLDASRINLVMLHGQEAQSDAKDKTEIINLRALRHKGIDYLALGHVHAPKIEELDQRGVYCYPGCLEARGFDECGEHGFMLLDIDEQSGQIEYRFVNAKGRQCEIVSVDVTGCMDTAEVSRKVGRSLQEANCDALNLVRVRLVGTVDVASEIDVLFLRKRFEPDYFVFDIVDETSLHIEELDYRTDKTLKGEFVRAVMARTEYRPEEQAEIIRYGLQAIAGEEIGG